MKNINSLLTLGAALLAMAVSSSATVYTDTNTHNTNVYEGDTVTGTWNYGPIAAGEVVTSVESWFNFSSGDRESEEVRVIVGTDGFDDQSFTSNFTNFGDLYTVHFAASSLASLLADAANGALSYSVTAVSHSGDNNFYFSTAKVNVTASNPSSRVPEGGATVALLGLTFLGFAGVQRKFRLVR